MSVLYLEKSVFENLTESGIREILKASGTVSKYQKLQDYYEGKHDILRHHKRDSTLPNNRLVNNMAKRTTDTLTGYFMGKPVAYASENTALLAEVQDVLEYNDEQDHNMELAKTASIKGRAFEMLYIDEDQRLRFVKLQPDDLVLIKESAYKQPLGAIRTVNLVDLKGNTTQKVEFWTWQETWLFRSRNGGALELVDVTEHFWQDVPFVEYINNEECQGDFEGIISLIDAYNKVQSNTANIFQYNDEAILTIVGLGDVSAEEIAEMKEKCAIVLEEKGGIDWLLKEIDDEALENFKNRLTRDMHIYAGIPDMSDENFAGNASGVAMDYKLWNMDQIRVIKERKFKPGLQRRFELMCRMLNVMHGTRYDYRDIDITFRPNKPQNWIELAEIFVQLAGGVSQETRLQMLPMIENVQDEIMRLKKEKAEDMADFGSYDSLLEALEKLKQPGEEAEADGPAGTQPADRTG